MKKIIIAISIILSIIITYFSINFISNKNNITFNYNLDIEISAQPKINDTELSIITSQQNIYDSIIKEYNEEEHDIDNPYIIVDPYNMNNLAALVIFETTKEAKVTYTVTGDIEFTQTIEGLSTYHEIPIICLYENTDNIVIITLEYEDNTTKSVEIIIPIEEITNKLIEIDTTEYTQLDDYFIQLSATGSAINNFYWIDTNSDLRFFMSKGFGVSMHFTEDSTILANPTSFISAGKVETYSNGIIEMDYLGRVIKYYKIPYEVHHDYIILENNNLLVLTSDESYAIEDTIIEIDRTTGEIVDEIDIKQILDKDYDSRMGNHPNIYDWLHINSIVYIEEDDSLLISARQQAVFSINKTTKELNWIIAEEYLEFPEELKEYLLTPIGDDFEYPYGQHSAIITSNDTVMVFDNGNNRADENGDSLDSSLLYSRVVEYKIDTTNMSVEQVFQYGTELGNDFYCFYISNVEELYNNNLLINFGGLSYTKEDETNANKATIFEYDYDNKEVVREINIYNGHIYRANKINFLDELTVYKDVEAIILYDDSYYNEKLENSEVSPLDGFKQYIYINNYIFENNTYIEIEITNATTNNTTTQKVQTYTTNNNTEAYIVIETLDLENGEYYLEYKLLEEVNEELMYVDTIYEKTILVSQ